MCTAVADMANSVLIASAKNRSVPNRLGSIPSRIAARIRTRFAPSPRGEEAKAVLISVLSQRAPELGEHGHAVKSLAVAVGREFGLSMRELAVLSTASELHDVGKVAIPDAILTKPASLDEHEWRFMREHTVLGERIVSAAPSLAPLGRLIRASHERWDGRGYPDGLSGGEIPLAARIIFACDAYDAITTERPYSPAREPESALEELRLAAGSQFDPEVIRSQEQVLRAIPAGRLAVPSPLAA
jgi:HD-GYP domain-containing protein (c-di-GMP phosphodiesterase class II)